MPLADGRVEVFGRPAGDAGRDIGYLPQRRSFDPGMRVRGIDVVRWAPTATAGGFPLPWGRSPSGPGAPGVDEVIDLVGAGAYALGRSARSPGASSNACSSPRRWCASPGSSSSTSRSTVSTCPTRRRWRR